MTSLDPPVATEYETRALDQIDRLTAVMAEAIAANDGAAFLDALDESQFCERRLAVSREGTWALWFDSREAA